MQKKKKLHCHNVITMANTLCIVAISVFYIENYASMSNGNKNAKNKMHCHNIVTMANASTHCCHLSVLYWKQSFHVKRISVMVDKAIPKIVKMQYAMCSYKNKFNIVYNIVYSCLAPSQALLFPCFITRQLFTPSTISHIAGLLARILWSRTSDTTIFFPPSHLLTLAKLHVRVLTSFIKLIKHLQNLMKLLPNHIMV